MCNKNNRVTIMKDQPPLPPIKIDTKRIKESIREIVKEVVKELYPDEINGEILIKHGFVKVHEYPHDEWFTKCYQKGVLTVSITTLEGKYEYHDISIEDTFFDETPLVDILCLDEILNRPIDKSKEISSDEDIHQDSNDYRERYDNQEE